jgi:hypothetical protein
MTTWTGTSSPSPSLSYQGSWPMQPGACEECIGKGCLSLTITMISSTCARVPAVLYGLRPGFGQDNGRPDPNILCLRSVPGRTGVTCSSSLAVDVVHRLAVARVHRSRPGIGSASAARQGGAWKGPAKYWVSSSAASVPIMGPAQYVPLTPMSTRSGTSPGSSRRSPG